MADGGELASRLSVVLITLNEEARLPHCLRSLPRGSEVVVLDSGSTDRTVEVARELGARVETRPFTTYSEQKNAAVALATREWVLSVDADEVLDEGLRAAIVKATKAESPAGYTVTRRLVFMGRLMRFGKTTDHPLRLFRRGTGRFTSDIHEKVVLDGGAQPGRLSGEMLHHSYEDLSDYFRRFNSYTTRIAENHRKNGKRSPPLIVHCLRPWAEFVGRYFVRLGFLDGYPGFAYALVSSLYVFVKYAKLKELEAR